MYIVSPRRECPPLCLVRKKKKKRKTVIHRDQGPRDNKHASL